MPRATFSLACLLWLALIGAADAQSSMTVNDPGFASLQNFSGGVTYGGSYFQLYNVAGNGVGYHNGYSQFGVLTPYWFDENNVAAFNGRLLVTNTQDIGGNIGGLFRHYSSDWDRLFGVYGYWDLDQSALNNHYEQANFGIESLGYWWDFRANGYIPGTSGNRFVQTQGLGQDLFYFGNRIGFLGLAEYEQTLYGGDFEFGAPVTAQTGWLRAYAGMYFYGSSSGHGDNPVGVRGRLEGWVSDDLSLGMMVQQDQQWGTNVQFNMNFLFSGWKPTRWFPSFATRERMLMPVQRNWRVATERYNEKVNVPAMNPRTNEPYYLTWVDDSNPNPGDGTYENPFSAMPGASLPADLVLVRTGNTTALSPLNSSIQLTNFQRMLGEGREHEIDAYANFGAYNVPVQTFLLPEFTNSGNYPWLSGTPSAISLASNNEVSAFNILNSLGAGISNTLIGSHNFDLNYLNLISNTGGGISLSQATGVGTITNVNAVDNLGGGISIDSGFRPLDLTIQDVTATSTLLGLQGFGITVRADNGPVVAHLTNVAADNNDGIGIVLSESNSLQAVLNNVTATSNLFDGLRVIGVGGNIDLSLTDVDTSSNLGRGIYVTGVATDITFAMSNLTDNSNTNDNINFSLTLGSTLSGGLSDTNFDDSVIGSGIVLSVNNSTIGTLADPFLIQNVTADRNAFGLSLAADNTGLQFVTVTDSSFSDNTLDGINVAETGGSAIVLSVDPTIITGNTRDGLHLDLQDGSTLIGNFAQDTLDDNGRSAVWGNVDVAGSGGSVLDLTLTDTTGMRSGVNGLFITSDNGANVTVDVTNGDFSDSGQLLPLSSAVRFDATDSVVNLTMTGTPGQNTAAYPGGTQAFGLTLNLDNTQFTGTVTDGNFSNNLVDGILAVVLNGSTATLDLTNVPVDGNGIDGLNATVTGGSSAAITATDSSFSNNGQAGFGFGQGLDLGVIGALPASILTVDLYNTPVDSNEMEGIVGTATGTLITPAVLALNTHEGTTVDSNGLLSGASGVELTNNAGVILANFTDSDISSNGNRGVGYTGVGQGTIDSSLTFINNAISGTTDSNAGDGLYFSVTGGNRLNLDAEFADFSFNEGYGVNGFVDGAGSSVIIDEFLFATADFNGLDGFNLLVDNSGFVNGNFNGGSFSFNGQTVPSDGVHVRVDNNAVALLCFDGTVVDLNSDDGFDFAVQNGGTLYVALQTSGVYGTLSASDNANQPVVFDIGPGANGGLFMDGPSVFTGNTGLNGFEFTANGANQAAFSFSGSSDGNVGDGIYVQMTNVADAYIDIHGPGTLNNNGSNGVQIDLDTVTFGTLPLTVSFLQGDFTANPFNISDMTISTNGDEGILINANNVTMPVGTIVDNSIDNSGQNGTGDGILLNVTGGSVFTDFTMDGNVSDDNLGNGISVVGVNSSFGTLTVSNGGMHSNEGHGLNLDLNNTPIDTLNITGNDQGLSELVGLGFFVDGSTFGLPFTIENTSSAAVDITGFLFDISTNIFFPDANFDTDSPPVQTASAAVPFAPLNGTEITTGLVTINGTTNPPGWEIPDESQIMTATFNDFNPGEQFQWEVDLDQTFGGDEGYSGDQLVGSTVSVNFSNGANLTGFMLPVIGFPEASEFVATGGTLTGPGISNNHGDGIHIEQVNSDIAQINITDNEIDGNDGITGSGDPGHGIHFAVVNNSALPDVNINGNTIMSNTGDGVRLIDPTLPLASQTILLTANNNTIDLNGGNGVNLEMNQGQILSLNMAGNTIGTTGNGNVGMGVRAIVSDASTLNATFGSAAGPANNITGNGDAGIGIIMSDNAIGTLLVRNTNISETIDGAGPGADPNFAGVGLGVLMTDNANLTDITLGSAAAQNTSFNDNAADGFLLSMSNTTTITNQVTIQNVQADDNTGNGVNIDLTDSASIPLISVTGTLPGSEFSGNTGNGFTLTTNSLASVDDVTMQTVTAEGNTGDGLNFFRQGSSAIGRLGTGSVTIDDAHLNGNTGNGLNVTAADLDATDVYVITNSEITGNTGNGAVFNLVADADLDVTITGSDISGNTLSGIQTTTNSDVTDSPTILLDIELNTINDNTLDGINILTPHLAFIDTNTISGNGRDGISIGIGSYTLAADTITNNLISDNGDDGIDVTASFLLAAIGTAGNGNAIIDNGDDGLAFTSNSNGGAHIIGITENLIQGNGGDGTQISASNGSGSGLFINSYAMTDNWILDSGARGINIVNGGGSQSTPTTTVVDIDGNEVRRSGLEAIYVINTASETQGNAANIDNLASAALLANGSVFAKPLLDLTINDNIIDSNGQTQDAGDFIGASGIVLQVGTSDATDNISSSFDGTDRGGFASGGRGGVVAAITDNTFTGQYGADATFRPFISTGAPPTTAGTWTDQNENPRDATNDVFNVTSYVQDPLARLDLIFTGNTGDGLLATNSLASSAYYNNDEPEFKSRGITGVSSDTTADGAPNFAAAPDDNGPFTTGTRHRNATALTYRDLLPPTIAAGSSFQYSGLGDANGGTPLDALNGSTFRVNTTGPANTFTTVTTGFGDSVPIGVAFGEIPFVWGVLP